MEKTLDIKSNALISSIKDRMEAIAGEAMDTLKMKIGLLKSENKEASEKMAKAEKVVIEISNNFSK